jgi:uncharacterized membrane protein HdeD (DUF308 family)
MVVLGLLAVARPMIATLAVEIFAGWLFLIGGIVGLAGIFTAWKTPGILWTLIRAVLAIVAGLVLLWRLLAGVLTLTLILTAFFAAQGMTQIIVSISQRATLPGSWVWLLVSGSSIWCSPRSSSRVGRGPPRRCSVCWSGSTSSCRGWRW